MPTQKTLREIIDKYQHRVVKFCNSVLRNQASAEELQNMDEEIISEIKSLLKEKLPTKIDMKYTGDRIMDILRDVKNEYGCGYNECLTEIEKILEAL